MAATRASIARQMLRACSPIRPASKSPRRSGLDSKSSTATRVALNKPLTQVPAEMRRRQVVGEQ